MGANYWLQTLLAPWLEAFTLTIIHNPSHYLARRDAFYHTLQSALLQLPGELQNNIYHLVFRDDENPCVVDYDPGEAHSKHVRAKMRRLLGLDCLRRVCRQLRLEIAGMNRIVENVAGFLCPDRTSSVTTDIARVTFWYLETFVYQSMRDCLCVSKCHPQAYVYFPIKEKVLPKGKIAPFVNHTSMRFLLRRCADEFGL